MSAADDLRQRADPHLYRDMWGKRIEGGQPGAAEWPAGVALIAFTLDAKRTQASRRTVTRHLLGLSWQPTAVGWNWPKAAGERLHVAVASVLNWLKIRAGCGCA